jgi:hypothetical protein
MAAPAIALRFRDTTPGVDTILAHKAILNREGAVWWGWWKKDFEDDHLAYLNTLQDGTAIEIFIIDRSTRRMFLAESLRWQLRDKNSVDRARIPEYYRDHTAQVFCWFLLDSIDEVEFDDNIATNFGDHTLIQLDAHADGQSEKVAVSASALTNI